MLKKISTVLVIIIVMLSFTACGNREETNKDNSNSPETVAIHIGDINIYLDEARYYLYTSQASYETYYLTKDTEIDWKSKMKEGVTWEEFVKGATLDDICRRECMYSLREQYNVSLTDEEKQEVQKMAGAYFANTAENLQQKIRISDKRLKQIFEKKLIAEKVTDILEAMNAEKNEAGADENVTGEKTNQKANAIYKKWKSEYEVKVYECFREIHFDEPVFTKESLTEAPIVTEEITATGQLKSE